MTGAALHAALKPLAWLQGKWTSVTGKAFYPTHKTVSFSEEIVFTPKGTMLVYSAVSVECETKKLLHMEYGFLRILPDTNRVAFMLAHGFGGTTIEEGQVDGTSVFVKSGCNTINMMSFYSKVALKGTERCYCLKDDELRYTMRMETEKTPITDHLEVVYKKKC